MCGTRTKIIKNVLFVAKRQEVFEQYFSFIGFDIVLDRENGVVMLRNSAEFGENGNFRVTVWR
ncbi:MAG: hypothetical protein ACLU80_02750 [Dorea sp.]